MRLALVNNATKQCDAMQCNVICTDWARDSVVCVYINPFEIIRCRTTYATNKLQMLISTLVTSSTSTRCHRRRWPLTTWSSDRICIFPMEKTHTKIHPIIASHILLPLHSIYINYIPWNLLELVRDFDNAVMWEKKKTIEKPNLCHNILTYPETFDISQNGLFNFFCVAFGKGRFGICSKQIAIT